MKGLTRVKDKLFVVVPCYNEQEVLGETSTRLREKMKDLIEREIISQDSRIVFVDDGSRDITWQLIENLHEQDEIFSGVKLSRNRGHQNALLGGLMTVKDECDVTISMDADLQDDIDAIDGFLEKYYEGCDVVYGVRSSRKTDSFFKRFTAQGFYKFMNKMGVASVYNHADYRLLSRRALDALSKFREVNLFLRGMVPLVGYKSDTVEYERNKRFAGESKYPLKKMLAFAFDGITSFSVRPIKFITKLGLVLFVLSALALITVLMLPLFGVALPVLSASILCSVWMVGSLIMMCVGLVGQYVGKTYAEVKDRPRYIIETYLKK